MPKPGGMANTCCTHATPARGAAAQRRQGVEAEAPASLAPTSGREQPHTARLAEVKPAIVDTTGGSPRHAFQGQVVLEAAPSPGRR